MIFYSEKHRGLNKVQNEGYLGPSWFKNSVQNVKVSRFRTNEFPL